ncbi:MAG: aminotransferase class I/II-fold pyridoxal phosphate-dependent enzyme [Lachnospiraceae bacterium]|nr:aminotransferase class I/II-fold pyridoxal phosphate-dependent enzyme [Lachnospiraceae bacterium]
MERPIHGGDVWLEGREHMLDFSVSINPLGMPKEVQEAAMEGVRLSGRYPDIGSRALTGDIAERYGLPKENILVGNGAAELIDAACRAIRPGHIMTEAPTFTEYERAANAKWTDRIDEADLVCICNPNNPTGKLCRKEALLAMMEECGKRGIFMMVDESFLPFSEESEANSLLDQVENAPFLIVIRSFTKIYAMPGLRLGWAAVGNGDLRGKICASLQPWNVSVPAQLAGRAALRLPDFENQTRRFVKEERTRMMTAVSARPEYRIWGPSDANFFLFEGPEGLECALRHQDILIRQCADMRGLTSHHYRVAVRRSPDNDRLMRELGALNCSEL